MSGFINWKKMLKIKKSISFSDFINWKKILKIKKSISFSDSKTEMLHHEHSRLYETSAVDLVFFKKNRYRIANIYFGCMRLSFNCWRDSFCMLLKVYDLLWQCMLYTNTRNILNNNKSQKDKKNTNISFSKIFLKSLFTFQATTNTTKLQSSY